MAMGPNACYRLFRTEYRYKVLEENPRICFVFSPSINCNFETPIELRQI